MISNAFVLLHKTMSKLPEESETVCSICSNPSHHQSHKTLTNQTNKPQGSLHRKNKGIYIDCIGTSTPKGNSHDAMTTN